MPAAASNPRTAWVHLLWLGPIAVVFAAAAVLSANVIRDVPMVTAFIEQFPGSAALPDWAPVGFPAWLAWQHFLNGFLLLLIIRTAWEIRLNPKVQEFWTRDNTGPLHTRNPPRRISLVLWFHLVLDALWVLNGVVYYVLLFATGQWVRIVPVSWDVLPNALSVAIQYLSLDWPVENSWVNYNSLQLISYFLVVFVASPLAIITGIRMSSAWPRAWRGLGKRFPLQWAIQLHFPVMLFFLLFIVSHVSLVLATGALRNLNHMYGLRDDQSWTGVWFFAASIAVMVLGWVLARPILLRTIAAWSGTVSRELPR